MKFISFEEPMRLICSIMVYYASILKIEWKKVIKKQNKVAPSGFEPESSDPESDRIDRYPTGLRFSNFRSDFHFWSYKFIG